MVWYKEVNWLWPKVDTVAFSSSPVEEGPPLDGYPVASGREVEGNE